MATVNGGTEMKDIKNEVEELKSLTTSLAELLGSQAKSNQTSSRKRQCIGEKLEKICESIESGNSSKGVEELLDTLRTSSIAETYVPEIVVIKAIKIVLEPMIVQSLNSEIDMDSVGLPKCIELDMILELPFDFDRMAKNLREAQPQFPVEYVLHLLRYLCDQMLGANAGTNSTITDARLIDWMSVLLDAHLIQFVVSPSDFARTTLQHIASRIDDSSHYLKKAEHVRGIITQIIDSIDKRKLQEFKLATQEVDIGYNMFLIDF